MDKKVEAQVRGRTQGAHVTVLQRPRQRVSMFPPFLSQAPGSQVGLGPSVSSPSTRLRVCAVPAWVGVCERVGV